MPATQTRPVFDQIGDWLTDIQSVKTAAAATKKAAPAGMGKTTHPSEHVDNNTHPEQTGARFEENSSDVKKDVPGASVDETKPGSGGSQDDKNYNIGVNQAATGEDPAVEDDYKGDKDDPGTTHPADTERIGEKYSSMKLGALLKVATDKAHGILADLANGLGQQPQPTQTVSQQVAAVKTAVAAVPAQPQQLRPDMAKLAEDFIAQTIVDADQDADLVGAFVRSYHQGRLKRAADEAGEGESHKDEPDGGGAPPDPTGGGLPPGGDAGAGGPPPGAGGGGDALAALAGGGAGGPPPGGDMGAAAGGGMPPPGAGGDPSSGAGGAGGGMSQEQAIQELAMALEELGIPPEQLAQLAAQGGAGGAGGAGAGGPPPGAGMPPPGAGGPPPDAGGAAEGAKLASAVIQFKRAGKFRFQEAKTAAQYQAREQIKDYIREITGLKG